MKYVFVLGVGRSGTTFLGRVIAKSSTRMMFVSEPFPGIETFRDLQYSDPYFIPPFDRERQGTAISALRDVAENRIDLSDAKKRIERNDAAKLVLGVKEVHGLLAFPAILKGMDARAVVITRDTLRIIDSFFYGHKKRVRQQYLFDEYRVIKDYLKRTFESQDWPIMEAALVHISPACRKAVLRPAWLSSDVKRQLCITEILKWYLIEWANQAENVMHVSHEELSAEPVKTSIEVFRFLGLEFEDKTLDSIKSMTTGGEKGYYDTNKDSRSVLHQSYRFLSTSQVEQFRNLLNSVGQKL